MILKNISCLDLVALFPNNPISPCALARALQCCPKPFPLHKCYLEQVPAMKIRSSQGLQQNSTPGPDNYMRWRNQAEEQHPHVLGNRERGKQCSRSPETFYKFSPLRNSRTLRWTESTESSLSSGPKV